jgi:phosphoglycerate dehydrogenase-like enzyme
VEAATDIILFASSNVICTPHLGASTHEAPENVAMQIAEKIFGLPSRPQQVSPTLELVGP